MSVRVLQGDCRALLPTLPAESVHCVVTSPPYWGLRDYGTASWDGGDEACGHVAQRKPPVVGSSSTLGFPADGGPRRIAEGNGYHEAYTEQYRDTCGKCGARRMDQQLGLEPTPEAYVAAMVGVFREVRRVLRDDGTLWLNMGDSYAHDNTAYHAQSGAAGRPMHVAIAQPSGHFSRQHGLKTKDLVGMPWRLAFALQADGWYLRADIIWAKPNPMPESVTDRPTKAHEYIFLLTKSARYFYDADAVREPLGEWATQALTAGWTRRSYDGPPERHDGTGTGNKGAGVSCAAMVNPAGRNLRSVWTIPSAPFSDWTKTVRRVPVAPDAADGGTKRITSPDCPVHGDRLGPVASAGHDAHGGDCQSHSEGNGSDPAPARLGERGPIGLRPDDCSADESQGWLLPSSTAPASPHSTGNHRTDRAPATTAPCTLSEETPSDTPRSAAQPASADSADHSDASSSGQDGSAGRPSVQIVDRSGDIASCRCTYYREITENTSHFATFPPALASRCIQAGTSERGCCAACGAPWARQTEPAHVEPDRSQRSTAHYNTAQRYGAGNGGNGGFDQLAARMRAGMQGRETTGWQPSCACDAPVMPCTVLDPFGGSGTVGAVAEQLGRHSILIELSAPYVAMAEERTAQLGLFAQEAGKEGRRPSTSALKYPRTPVEGEEERRDACMDHSADW